MHIVMHAGGIPFNGDTIKERSLGGSETAAYYVAKELAARGHKIVLFTECDGPMMSDGVQYISMGERTEQKPLGVNWHFYCENTPHEVNIVQRVPHAFAYPIQSKINLWWAHDIALKRNHGAFLAQGWQTNRILPVSNWFKKQIVETWGANPAVVAPIHNGVDYSLFDEFELKDNMNPRRYVNEDEYRNDEIILVYSSRPERGLEHLVAPGGIMEQLVEKAPHIQLKVCGYEHPVPQLDSFYAFLRERIDQLPNCEHIGALTKNDLVEFMCTQADVWCYPTEFEEVSCITAMEAMAAGLTIITTNVGALPETIGDYENATIYDAEKGVDIDRFVNHLVKFNNQFKRKPRRSYSWTRTVDEIEEIIEDEFEKANCGDMYRGCDDAVARHYLRNSDIIALDKLDHKNISQEVLDQIKLYEFRHNQEAYAKHYADGTEEMYDGPEFHYEGEDFIHHPRFQQIAEHLKTLDPGSNVIDYGCAHGHFTNYLAKMFPELRFLGVDVSPAALKCARAKKEEMGLGDNVMYRQDDWLNKLSGLAYDVPDCIILGEILEHVPDPGYFMDMVRAHMPEGPIIITTPFGPWEQMSYEKEDEKRFHLHHFERADLCDMFEHHEDFQISCLPTGPNQFGELLGWYVTTFKFSDGKQSCKPINYCRKLKETVPRQTVSYCGIAKDASRSIERLLDSIHSYVDEIIVGVDETTTDNTFEIIENYAPKNRAPALSIKVFKIPSPIEVGFDAARNLTIKKATKQWIMWADSDEEFICGERLPKFLRLNGWDGYGIPQHHFAVEPLGVLSTDFPVRIYRNKPGIEFVGVVHEHPTRKSDVNDGIGFAWVNHEVHFAHTGYTTENIRRTRFQRNIKLMYQDRETNPDRILGRYLWIRDLALMCRFDLENTGAQITPEMRHRAEIGIKLWEETLDKHSDHPQVVRMVRDHLEFYSTLVMMLDQGFDFKMRLSSGLNGSTPPLEATPEISGRFLNKRHLDKFLSVVINNEVENYGQKYL